MFIAFVILTLFFSFLLLNYLYKNTSHYKFSISDVSRIKNYNSDEGLKIAVIGSNQPKYAFDFDSTGGNGENWSIGPEAFEYDHIILNKLLSRLSKGSIVVMPVCLLSFFLYRFDNINTYSKYYGFLSKEEFPHYSKLGFIKAKFPLLSNPLLIRYIVLDSDSKQRCEFTNNPLSNEELKRDAENWIFGWEKQFNITLPNVNLSDNNKLAISNNIKLLSEMITLCINNDITPIITVLPITDVLMSKFTSDFIQHHILDYIEQANLGRAEVLNYLQDNRFLNYSLYFNSFFLNRRGREYFTNSFICDLKKRGLYD